MAACLLVFAGLTVRNDRLPKRQGPAPDLLPAQRSASITVSASGQNLIVVNPDSNTVSFVHLPSHKILAEVSVDKNPQTVAVCPVTGRIFVVSRDRSTVSLIDPYSFEEIASAKVGDQPYGVVASKDGRVFVSNTGSSTVSILNAHTLDLLVLVRTEEGPRGLALSPDGSFLYITHFLSGKLSILNTAELTMEKVVSTGTDTSVSQGIAIDWAHNLGYLPQTRSNVTHRALLFDTTVFPVVSVVDLITDQNLLRKRIALDVVDRPVNLPLDALLTSSGYLCVINAGSDDLSIIDLNTRFAVAHLALGHNPRGAALGPDGKILYVNNMLNGSVSVVDTAAFSILEEIQVTRIPLPSDLLNGKILFNTSSRSDLSRDRWVSCATCHFDAEMDGRTWFFRDGPRNTPSLIGVGETLPIHWSGDLDELEDVEGTVRTIQAGSGLTGGASNCEPTCDQAPPNAGRSKDLDDLAAYMRSLAVPSSPNLTPKGFLTPAARRGQALFFSQEAQCVACHPPPLYTDRLKHDVGTATSPLEAKGSAFDTPSLRGIYRTAPYLHDGSASTLLELLVDRNRQNRHGRTAHLNAEQLQDLVQFLLSLPFGQEPNELPEQPDSGAPDKRLRRPVRQF